MIDAAEMVLKREGAVGLIELYVQLRFLDRVHVEHWRRSQPGFQILEQRIECGAKKLADTERIFRQWAQDKKLESTRAVYEGSSRDGGRELQILRDDNSKRDQFLRTRYQRSDHSDARKKQIDRKLNKMPDLLVHVITDKQGKTCAECELGMPEGEWMFQENGQPLCLSCADLDHLEFLPSGDATLSRRTKKYSGLSAIVMDFNRRRKRYQRLGLLATREGIEQARDSMESDAGKREKQRAAATLRRERDDTELVESVTIQINRLFPSCPIDDAKQIAEHTAERGSGRVGRSEAGREADAKAVKLAVIAHIRHIHTPYDQMLMKGVPRREARTEIQSTVQAKLRQWEQA